MQLLSPKCLNKCKADHPNFQPTEILLGIVMDWSDAEINGLKRSVGEYLSLKEVEFLDKNCNCTIPKKWVEWWIKPQHLKMLHKDYADMDLGRDANHQPMLLNRRIEIAKLLLHNRCFLH